MFFISKKWIVIIIRVKVNIKSILMDAAIFAASYGCLFCYKILLDRPVNLIFVMCIFLHAFYAVWKKIQFQNLIDCAINFVHVLFLEQFRHITYIAWCSKNCCEILNFFYKNYFKILLQKIVFFIRKKNKKTKNQKILTCLQKQNF